MGGRRPAVFLDRDGTIIEDRHYLGDPDQVSLLPGAAEGIAALNRAGLPVIVVTNQSGIGRGYFDEGAYEAVTARLRELLEREGAGFQGCYHCPHSPDDQPPCDCRKPRAGLFERAAEEHALDLAASYYIGDRLRDLLPGIGAGGEGYLVEPEPASAVARLPDRVQRVQSLQHAVTRLLATPR